MNGSSRLAPPARAVALLHRWLPDGALGLMAPNRASIDAPAVGYRETPPVLAAAFLTTSGC